MFVILLRYFFGKCRCQRARGNSSGTAATKSANGMKEDLVNVEGSENSKVDGSHREYIVDNSFCRMSGAWTGWSNGHISTAHQEAVFQKRFGLGRRRHRVGPRRGAHLKSV